MLYRLMLTGNLKLLYYYIVFILHCQTILQIFEFLFLFFIKLGYISCVYNNLSKIGDISSIGRPITL